LKMNLKVNMRKSPGCAVLRRVRQELAAFTIHGYSNWPG